MSELNLSEWDNFLSQYPDVHLLQTGLWGEFKSQFGWDAVRMVTAVTGGKLMGAQILFRHIPLGYSLAYIPKGPITEGGQAVNLSDWDDLWTELDIVCKQRKSIFLRVEPDLLEQPRSKAVLEQTTQPIAGFISQNKTTLDDVDEPIPEGFRLGKKNIQPRRTILISLNGDEDRIIGRMKQKTRYNVRLALKKGVVVRKCTDLALFYGLVAETGNRDAFAVHSLDYYNQAYEIFHPRGMCELFVAEYQGEPLAAIMVFASGKRAWYFYGASSDVHRERMPTYLLQWEAMRWAKSIGCTEYDLWGIPDEDIDILESQFAKRSDGLWGVYRFKRGFGGRVFRAAGSWDRIYKPAIYSIYSSFFER